MQVLLKKFIMKTPAFLGADGFKFTEIVTIAEYFVTLVSDTKLSGKDDKEKAQITRWLSLFNQDVKLLEEKFVSELKPKLKLKPAPYLVFLFKYIDYQLANQKYLVNDSYVTTANVSAYVTLDRNIAKGVQFPNIIRFLKDIIGSDPVAAELSKK